MGKFKEGEIVSLVCGKVKLVVTGYGDKGGGFRDHVHVCWEQNDRLETMFLPEKCLRPEQSKLTEHEGGKE